MSDDFNEFDDKFKVNSGNWQKNIKKIDIYHLKRVVNNQNSILKINYTHIKTGVI
jgi:hypothetical protein